MWIKGDLIRSKTLLFNVSVAAPIITEKVRWNQVDYKGGNILRLLI